MRSTKPAGRSSGPRLQGATLLVTALMALTGTESCRAAADLLVPANRIAEWHLTGVRERADPFGEITLDALLRDETGREIRLPAYWDGDRTWRFRFSAPRSGLWHYETVCSDSGDTGLHGQKGTVRFAEVPATERNPVWRHGALRLADNGRHFAHADGQPFFWLADSWWFGMSNRLRYPEEFELLVRDRVKKGFSVIQFAVAFPCDIEPFDPRGANEAGHAWSPGFGRINPAYFAHTDRRIRHLVDAGLVPNLVGAWGYYLPFMGVEKMKLHWRYLVARYGAFPLVWTLAGESTLTYYIDTPGKVSLPVQVNGWTEVARHLREIDPYRRLLTVHPGPGSGGFRPIADMTLLDFILLQPGHSDWETLPIALEHLARARREFPRQPSFMGEVCFEGMHGGGSGPKIQRFLFWTTVLSGAPGYSYGTDATWQFNRRDEPFGPSPHGMTWGNIPWEDGYQLPGSIHLGVGRSILEGLEWWKLEPRPEWVTPVANPENIMRPYCASAGRETRVIYLPKGLAPWAAPIRLRGFEDGIDYQARYVDPITGRSEPPVRVAAQDGEWALPRAPVLQDWVMVIERYHPAGAVPILPRPDATTSVRADLLDHADSWRRAEPHRPRLPRGEKSVLVPAASARRRSLRRTSCRGSRDVRRAFAARVAAYSAGAVVRQLGSWSVLMRLALHVPSWGLATTVAAADPTGAAVHGPVVHAAVHFDQALRKWDGFGFNYVETAQTLDYGQDPQDYGGFSILDAEEKAEIVRLIFGADGLDVNLVKMFQDPWHQREPGAPYDHKRTTANMREFVRMGLQTLRARGEDMRVITTLYGPPPWATQQKILRGRDLDPAMRQPLADYMASWVGYLRAEGFPVEFYSLHNEGEALRRWPSDGRSGSIGSGHDYNMFWPPEEVVTFLKLLPKTLQRAGLGDVGVTNGEPTLWARVGRESVDDPGAASGYADAIVADPSALENLALITSHAFAGHSSRGIDLLREHKPDLHAWTTSSSWKNMGTDFIHDIWVQIYDVKVNACIPWAGIQRPSKWLGGDPNPGSAITVYEDGRYVVRPGYYFYKQLTQAGQPGMMVVQTASADADVSLMGFAKGEAEAPDSFIINNRRDTATTLTVKVTGTRHGRFEAVRTTEGERGEVGQLLTTGKSYSQLGSYAVEGGVLTYVAPPGSVTTFFGR